MKRALVAVVAVGALAACPTNVAAGKKTPPPAVEGPHFYADPPFGIGFQCVTIGCDEEKTLVIENRGGGSLGISKVRLSVDASADYAIRRSDGAALPTPEAQVFLAGGEKLELLVRYRPSDGTLDAGAVQMEHYDAAKAYNDSAPKTESVPLTARAFGSPAATLPTEIVDFGYVALGQEKTLALVVGNTGEAEVLTVGPAKREDGSSPVFHAPSPRDWGVRYANPGESARIPIVFSPAAEGAYFGAVVLTTNDPLRPGIRVVVQGTAIPAADLVVVDPVGDLVMPPMRSGESRTRPVTVQNLGGTPLDFTATITSGAELGISVDLPQASAIEPLATVTLAVTLAAQAGGAVDGTLTLLAADGTPTEVHVHADVDAPQLTVDPFSLDFGRIVQGWTAPAQQLAISNTGFGALTVSSIAFELGSSSQITLVDVPTLPVKLAPGDDPILVTVLLQAVNIGPADAVLLINTDSIDNAVRRTDVHGDIITCDEGCPTANGTPSCDSGICEVGSCVPGFHNPDGFAGNGCECREDVVGNVVGDIGSACGAGLDLGTLHDGNNGGTKATTRDGTLHAMNDQDLYFFRASDDGCIFCSDHYGADVTLNGPRGMQLCANFQGSGTGCGGIPNNCVTIGSGPVTIRGSGQGGLFGSSDNSEDVTVVVQWPPNTAPQCGVYSLFMRADGNF